MKGHLIQWLMYIVSDQSASFIDSGKVSNTRRCFPQQRHLLSFIDSGELVVDLDTAADDVGALVGQRGNIPLKQKDN